MIKEFEVGEEVIYAPMRNKVLVVKEVHFSTLILVDMNGGVEIGASKSLVYKKPLAEPTFGRKVDDPPVFRVGDTVTYEGITDRYFVITKTDVENARALLEGYHGQFEKGINYMWMPVNKLTHIRDMPYIPNHDRPPKGIMPRLILDQGRLEAIDEAIAQHIAGTHPITTEWIEERNEIVLRLRKAKSKPKK